MDSSIKDLSRYRFETSLENITDAKIMYDNGRYKNTLNRTYYSIFHAIRAVCALDGFDSSKHSGVISYFNLLIPVIRSTCLYEYSLSKSNA